jgi:hypothetical protein
MSAWGGNRTCGWFSFTGDDPTWTVDANFTVMHNRPLLQVFQLQLAAQAIAQEEKNS